MGKSTGEGGGGGGLGENLAASRPGWTLEDAHALQASALDMWM